MIDYHVKVISYFHARVARWSTTLPRWGRGFDPSRALFIFQPEDCTASSPAFVLSDSRLIYKMEGSPHGSAFPFYLISDCVGIGFTSFCFDRIKIFHDSHMYGPGHPVLVFLILQTLLLYILGNPHSTITMAPSHEAGDNSCVGLAILASPST